MKTLYEYATEVMLVSIDKYLDVVKKTSNFTAFPPESLNDADARDMILAGKSLLVLDYSPEECARELERVSSIKFDIEKGVSYYVYKHARKHIQSLIEKAKEVSENFSCVSPNTIHTHPYLLPIWIAALAIGSKSNFKAIFGSADDHYISQPAAQRVSNYANDFFKEHTISVVEITERVERTLEGIVRDLVGRVLFESIVENALVKAEVPFMSESEYDGIEGVVYKFRADFVIPDNNNPLAFIEVRKSSSRHASLYAKDKMFGSINWKGKHENLLGIIVTEGAWTNETLATMSKVFDYVVPLSDVETLAKNIKKYLEGDNSILKWIIHFSIDENPNANI